MSELHPQEIRDKIAGLLYKSYPLCRTRDEIAIDSGLDAGEVNRELVFLIETGLVQWLGQDSTSPATTEYFTALVAVPTAKFRLSSQGRKSVEDKTKQAPKVRSEVKSTSLTRIGLQPERASDLLEESRRSLMRAEDAKDKGDYSGAVASGQKAIEFAVKSVLLRAGFEPPKEHAVGHFLDDVIGGLVGEDWAMKLTRNEIARLAWLNKISASVQDVPEYGYLGVSAKDLITKSDAETWVKHAGESIGITERFFGLLTRGDLRT